MPHPTSLAHFILLVLYPSDPIMTSLHGSGSPLPNSMDYYMDYSYSLHHFSPSTATTPTNDDDYWNDWSPFLNLDSFTLDSADEQPSYGSPNSSISSTHELADGGVEGLRLVHLLMAAAEALSGGNKSHHLARVILIRLNHLVSPPGPTHPSTMERLASYFTHALQALLQPPHPLNNNTHPPMDIVAAFQLLQDMSPYLKFAHFTSNQAILEAIANDRRLHIIDFDIMEGIQWASLIQALSSTPHGPHFRITALSRTGAGAGRRSISTVQETGRRLTAFAASLGQPFSFHQCRLDPDETFRPSGLKLVRGEALVFNCMLHLPHLTHRPPESVASFLNGAKTLSPRLVTLVEEEEEDAGPGRGEGGFVGRFMECLHHYSALYDSLEAGIPMETGARTLVERVYLGPRIVRSVARIYSEGGGEGRPGSWGEWLGEMGYRGVGMSFSNQCQANLLLGLFNDGFKAEVVGSNRLVLSWRSRRLLSASLWTSS